MQRSARFAALTLSGLFASASCSDPGTTQGPELAGDESSESTTALAESESSSGPATTAPATTAPEPTEFQPYPARGIRLTAVYANQGVAVPVVDANGQWVDAAGRNAELINDRQLLIQGTWAVDDDWEPRDIRVRLTLDYDDGTQERASKTFTIESDSSQSVLDTTAWFVIPRELIKPRMKFQLELLETASGYEHLPEPELTAYPPRPGYIGIEAANLILRAVLVPIEHELPNRECPAAPVIDDAGAKIFADALYEQNPVQEVEIQVREPFVYEGSMQSFGNLLGALADLHAEDGADPSYYYYGLVIPCDGGPNGIGGQAISIPDSPVRSNAWLRTAVGRWYSGPSAAADTFVHEIGHTQGRQHVACSGTEGGPDPAYPYEGGDIGVWGFGVLRFGFFPPTAAKDYMTYCGNTWVSDYGWHKVAPFIREISSWDMDGRPVRPEASGRILVGLVDEAGVETWFETTGTAEGRPVDPDRVLEIESPSGTHRLPATVGLMGEGGHNLVVELPGTVDLADRMTTVTQIRGAERRVIPSIRTHTRSILSP